MSYATLTASDHPMNLEHSGAPDAGQMAELYGILESAQEKSAPSACDSMLINATQFFLSSDRTSQSEAEPAVSNKAILDWLAKVLGNSYGDYGCGVPRSEFALFTMAGASVHYQDTLSAGLPIPTIDRILKHRDLNRDLVEALGDLDEVDAEACEKGFPAPPNVAVESAERILCHIYAHSPQRYEVYPTPDREVAIYASGGYGRSVLLLCGPQGEALCLVNINGKSRRARYSTAEELPDGFLREALNELTQAQSGEADSQC